MRSSTCKGSTGQYLEEYHTKYAATVAAEETKQQYGHTLEPVQCNYCGYWHLRPMHKRLQCTQCTDSGLFFKDLYPSRQEAEKTAVYLKKEKRVQLYAYKCPHTTGWHLTKRKT
jgi:hypothetical protein